MSCDNRAGRLAVRLPIYTVAQPASSPLALGAVEKNRLSSLTAIKP